MKVKLINELIQIANYLGCNEAEFIIEVGKLVKKAKIEILEEAIGEEMEHDKDCFDDGFNQKRNEIKKLKENL